ncbi:MAG: DUF1080 domain-containing protein [Planctomycetaceae bacterium]|jgi:hypothetical protein|nr:DUF1080 domain-containing protein [Planctomycetaceae bacterium]
MKYSFLIIFIACGITAFSDEPAVPGYTDTPFLPNSVWRVHDQSRPQPVKVAPGQGDIGVKPPSDAVVLFDGSHLNQWKGKNLNAIEDGAFDIFKTGQLVTKDEFGSCQLHLEWMTPTKPVDRMEWGNSGVYLLGGIEIQIIESCDSHIYADGNAGAVYGQYPPLVNPARKPGEWQSFDIVFTAPKIKDGTQTEPARVTVFYNGVLVQNNVEIIGASLHRALPKPLKREKGHILLQEHHSPVKFRNIWVRPLADNK